MFALIAVFGIGAALRAWRTWQFLRSWLIRLESHPVRGAFNRLDPDVRGAPLWGSGKSRATLVTERRALELLVRIHELGSRRAALGAERRAAVATAFEALENLAAAEDSTIADERRAWFRAEAPRARRTYEAILGRETQALIDDVLSEPWCTGRVPAPAAAADGTSAAAPDPTSGAVVAQLVDLAEQLVATRWLRFVRYYLGHVRLQIEYAVAAFVAIVVALSVYAFAGVGTIRVAIVVLSATFAAFLATVLAQVDRDPLMSRITGTDANKLTADFLVRMATYGLLPAITVLMSFFPSLARVFAYFGQPFPR
ncbi:MAG: hypothetical protein U0610_07440 [bacterium]